MIFGSKSGGGGGKVMGNWKRLHNEKIYGLYCSPNISWVLKLRVIGWVGHVASMWEKRGVYSVLWGNMKECDHLEG
jgi:hypothetical protein